MGIPVYHMEAGNRCYDLTVPEEKNRRVIDHISSINLPYTGYSRENLLREGLPNNKIFVTGNPIKEVLDYYSDRIQHSTILERLELVPHQYIVATAHRAENVDNPVRLANILEAFETISQDLPIVFSCHPKTEQRMTRKLNSRIIVSKPMGFFDWVNLERNSRLAISDSGTVQEEMCLFRRPTITIRATTERPETVMCGSNIVTGLETADIVAGYQQALTLGSWTVPEEYTRVNVSDVVVNIIMGKM
jgi:UDP-N-acetylglucosamine 2-epimerase (non-hydrolysing)